MFVVFRQQKYFKSVLYALHTYNCNLLTNKTFCKTSATLYDVAALNSEITFREMVNYSNKNKKKRTNRARQCINASFSATVF